MLIAISWAKLLPAEVFMADKAVVDPKSIEMQSTNIDSTLQEQRRFEPPSEFSQRRTSRAWRSTRASISESVEHPDKFWVAVAERAALVQEVGQSSGVESCPGPSGLSAARSILSYNCLDRHVQTWRKNKAAIIWESEPGEVRTLTYQQLHREVQKFANVLKTLGVKKGDRVAIYMGMTPELAIAMLACARIGAPHTVVFGGFSSNALIDRIHDSQAVAVITQDGSYRRGAEVKLFPAVEEALKSCPTVKSVVVYKRTGTPINMQPGRDHWWHELMAKASDECPAEPLDSEHPLYILYTSGTTGKPKGIVHTTGGYSVGTYLTTKWLFDLKDEDTYWCTADIGWVTGPQLHRLWSAAKRRDQPDVRGRAQFSRAGPLLGDHRPAQGQHLLHRAHGDPHFHQVGRRMAEEARHVDVCACSARVGEPINPEAWMWYREMIGGNRCPIVDTWWQTETGHIMIDAASRSDRHQARFGDAAVLRRRAGHRRPWRASPCPTVRADIWFSSAVALNAPHDLWRSRPLRAELLVADSRHATSPATARAKIKTAISGSWAAWTTCSTSAAIV